MTLTDNFINNVQLQKEWSYDRNSVSTDALTPYTRQKVWWQCVEGHVWNATVYSRTRMKGSGCPACMGTVKQTL